MGLVGDVLGFVLTVFIVVLVVRAVLDLVRLAATPPWWVRRIRTVTHAVTEPVLTPVRRVVRPVRTGTVAIDLAFTIVFVLALILRQVAYGL